MPAVKDASLDAFDRTHGKVRGLISVGGFSLTIDRETMFAALLPDGSVRATPVAHVSFGHSAQK
jgi:hypothetical protein